MPLYDQRYQHWTPQFNHHFRWLPIVMQEYRLMSNNRFFRLLFIGGVMGIILRVLQIVFVNKTMSDPNSEMAKMLMGIDALKIDGRLFYDFLRMQFGVCVILSLLAGSGIIANDNRHKMFVVYFSRPLSRLDYFLGKFMALFALNISLTALPAIGLFALQMLLNPSWDYFSKFWWIPHTSLLYSLAIILPLVLGIIGCSALTKSDRYAASAFILLVFLDYVFVNILAESLRMRDLRVFSIADTTHHIGTVLFGRTPWLGTNIAVSLVFLGSIAALGCIIAFRRIRAVEIVE